MTTISLTTDFGLRNGFVGVMKGVIYKIAPEAKIVDISHLIAPQDIREGAFALWRAYSFFPEGAVHVYVVDPGVGTMRRPLAARIGAHFFVGPDNGLLTPILEDAGRENQEIEFVHLENPKFHLPKVSRTFHGRDIFVPAAAHLANGVALNEMGTPFSDPVRIQLTRPQKTSTGWIAHLTMIDTFGNLTTDLPFSALQGRTDILLRLRGAQVNGIVESYGHKRPGDLVAVVDSEDYIEIAVVNGSAAEKLGAKVGDEVEVILPPR
ncbi:MAG: SAM-dependent chlorinase/fluorinase [Chloroflexi bacterium]|nr:SAM-dependent chlorinase/fluorinase [Chloroflexota bacterium]